LHGSAGDLLARADDHGVCELGDRTSHGFIQMGATGRKYAIVLASGVILPACSRDNRGDYDAGYDAGYEAGQEDA
jgi:hypothetical protein